MLRELVPNARRVAVLINPSNPDSEQQLRDLAAATHSLGQEITVLRASGPDDIDVALGQSPGGDTGALLISADPLFVSRKEHIVGLIARLALPAMYEQNDFVSAGGLISYGASATDAYRQAGIYVGRILKGEKPADLPVTQPTKFVLAINLKTAKVLGLMMPQTLLAQADEVIE